MNIPQKASSFPPKPLTALHLLADATIVLYVRMFWVNHYDLTGLPSPEIMVSKRNHSPFLSFLALRFWLIECNLPRQWLKQCYLCALRMESHGNLRESHPGTTVVIMAHGSTFFYPPKDL